MKIKFTFFLTLSLLIFSSAGFSASVDIQKADALFKKGTFQEALKIYEQVYQENTDSEIRCRSFFRICESLARLYRYGDAAQKLINTPLPEKMPYRARILILKTEMMNNFLMQYSSIQRNDIINDEEESADPFKLTKDQIKESIDNDYKQLWELRNDLVTIKMENEGYYLNIEDIDFGMFPTLFDYVVFSWTDHLLRVKSKEITEKTVYPDIQQFLLADFKIPVNQKDPPILLAAETMTEAGRFKIKHRREAAERWRINRLLLPLNYTNLCNTQKIIQEKETDNPLQICRQQIQDILLKWMKNFKSKPAKAEAGLEAAQIFKAQGNSLQAVKLCEEIEEQFPKTLFAPYAQALRSQIQMPTLSMQVKPTTLPLKDTIEITTRNLKDVFFRIYKIDPYQLKDEYSSIHSYRTSWSHFLGQPNNEWLEKYLGSHKLIENWTFKTKDKNEYQTLKDKVTPPALENGFYLVLASSDNSFKIGSSLIQASFLNISDLVLIGSSGLNNTINDEYYKYIDNYGLQPSQIEADVFRLYSFNTRTGKPEAETTLDATVYKSWRSEYKNYKETTNETGIASLKLPIEISQRESNYYSIDPLAKKDKSYAFWRSQQNFSYQASNPLRIFIETDRPIYRPGHKVHAKAIVVKRNSSGFETLKSIRKVTFKAKDNNGKEFFTQTVNLNEFGSANISFEIPKGRLLGNYSITASSHEVNFSVKKTIRFTVEEYKRPEFEIILNPADMPWKYNEPVEIKGEAKYYFGGPVPNAPINYRIKRQVYIPWYFLFWFRSNYSVNKEEIASGKTTTDTSGNFTITFTPTPPPNRSHGNNIPDISRFIVDVDGRDAGGRTIETQQTYRAGKNGIFLVIQPEKGFYTNKDDIVIATKRLTINDTPAAGESSYEIFPLAEISPKDIKNIDNNYYSWLPPLDLQLKDVPNGKLVASGKMKHDKDGKADIKLKDLVQAPYRITLKTKDPWGGEISQDKIFVVATDPQKSLFIPAASITLTEQSEYKVGETAKFILGSGLGNGTYQVEVWTGEYFLQGMLLEKEQPLTTISLPVTMKMKGGFTVRWFGINKLDVLWGQISATVPWQEKELQITLNPFNKIMQPGKETQWGINVINNEKAPQQAELLALMYDRSLEYYVKSANPWLSGLYQSTSKPNSILNSVFSPYTTNIPITEGLLEKILLKFRQPPQAPQLPGLRSWRTWTRYRSFRQLSSPRSKYDLKGEGCLDESLPCAPAGMEVKKAKLGGNISQDKETPPIKIRKDFSATAFFKPNIITDSQGKATLSFISPERLSSWRIKLFAFTKDVREGILTQKAVTKKDLMVRLDLPRFFREKDKGTITAIVHNESEQELSGEIVIMVTENDKPVNDKLKLKKTEKTFSIKPHELSSFNWLLDIPNGITTYKITAVAIADKLSDAEEQTLPIYPSRQRLIESTFTSLAGSESKEMKISLKEDNTRINESMVLEISPQLALNILNTIPFLIEYPYGCVEQMLNKYIPLAITNKIYEDFPALKQAASKIPKRKTVTPPWDKDDPRRLTTLMETPWIGESEGQPTNFPIIDLLDAEIVKQQKATVFDKLKAAQLSNGAFPWWPGGKADPYMTLYVLAGFTEARRYGITIPEDIIAKALNYVNNEIPLLLEAEERNLAVVAYAAYVVTSFPENEFKEAKAGHDAARSWTIFLEKNIYALTPFGKAYLAYTYLRLGEKNKAESILTMALDGSREDPIAGVYWTPEKYSWIWYSDTVEKHAFFLRTLVELRPEDKRIPGMVQWLLFNRKGNVWKSTKASAAAIYALLDYLNQTGAMASDEMFQLNWDKQTYSAVVKADDWLEDPLRWQQKGFEIVTNETIADIKKTGPGIAFASLTWTYSTDQLPEASAPGMLNLRRKYYLRVKNEGENEYRLRPLHSGDKIQVGDQIEIHLDINTSSQFEYIHLKDLKPAGFEAETLLSGWKYDPLRFYEEPRDSLTNFFISWLPHGEYILRYRLRPTKPGRYRVGAATLQSMYAPELTAHSAGFIIEVE